MSDTLTYWFRGISPRETAVAELMLKLSVGGTELVTKRHLPNILFGGVNFMNLDTVSVLGDMGFQSLEPLFDRLYTLYPNRREI